MARPGFPCRPCEPILTRLLQFNTSCRLTTVLVCTPTHYNCTSFLFRLDIAKHHIHSPQGERKVEEDPNPTEVVTSAGATLAPSRQGSGNEQPPFLIHTLILHSPLRLFPTRIKQVHEKHQQYLNRILDTPESDVQPRHRGAGTGFRRPTSDIILPLCI